MRCFCRQWTMVRLEKEIDMAYAGWCAAVTDSISNNSCVFFSFAFSLSSICALLSWPPFFPFFSSFFVCAVLCCAQCALYIRVAHSLGGVVYMLCIVWPYFNISNYAKAIDGSSSTKTGSEREKKKNTKPLETENRRYSAM